MDSEAGRAASAAAAAAAFIGTIEPVKSNGYSEKRVSMISMNVTTHKCSFYRWRGSDYSEPWL